MSDFFQSGKPDYGRSMPVIMYVMSIFTLLYLVVIALISFITGWYWLLLLELPIIFMLWFCRVSLRKLMQIYEFELQQKPWVNRPRI